MSVVIIIFGWWSFFNHSITRVSVDKLELKANLDRKETRSVITAASFLMASRNRRLEQHLCVAESLAFYFGSHSFSIVKWTEINLFCTAWSQSVLRFLCDTGPEAWILFWFAGFYFFNVWQGDMGSCGKPGPSGPPGEGGLEGLKGLQGPSGPVGEEVGACICGLWWSSHWTGLLRFQLLSH